MADGVSADTTENTTFTPICRQGLSLTKPGVSTTAAAVSQSGTEVANFHRLEADKSWQNGDKEELFSPAESVAESPVPPSAKVTAVYHGKLVC